MAAQAVLALARLRALWQGSARLVEAFWPILVSGARCRSSVVEHSIGNGEVDSSILSGSTILASQIRLFNRPAAGSGSASASRDRAADARREAARVLWPR